MDSCNDIYNFQICSLLIKRFCSKTIDKVLTDELNEYFKSLFNNLYKLHKKLLKKLSSNNHEKVIIDSHIEFLRYYSINAQKLVEFGIELKSFKICQTLFTYLLSLNESFIKNNKDYYLKIKKTLVNCLNSLDVESFKEFLKIFDEYVSLKK